MKNTNFICGTKFNNEGTPVHFFSIENEELPAGGIYIAFVVSPDDTPHEVAQTFMAAARAFAERIEKESTTPCTVTLKIK